jgi:hypothetical protein
VADIEDIPTSTEWRALCEELIQLDKEQPTEYSDWKKRWNAAVSRTRAALAQPEPEEPVKYNKDFWRKDALEKLVYAATAFRLGIYSAEELEIAENRARFFLARWGRPAIEPVPVSERLPGPTDEELDSAFHEHCWTEDDLMDHDDFVKAARAVLARWGGHTSQEVLAMATAIKPVSHPDGRLHEFMLRVGGKRFFCPCGCNVFHKPDNREPELYQCNCCNTQFQAS